MNTDEMTEVIDSLTIENKLYRLRESNMKKLYKKAIAHPPSYLCERCRKKWLEISKSQKLFIEKFKGCES